MVSTPPTTEIDSPRGPKDCAAGDSRHAPRSLDDFVNAETTTSKIDAESSSSKEEIIDIEHVPVHDDPRKWTPLRKNMALLLIAGASMLVGVFTAIQNPAVAAIEQDLHATSSQFSLSISLFIAVQGLVPVAWSAISEIKGRKAVYVVSMTLATGSSIGIALSPNIGLLIGFRCIQGAGTSAFLAIGAATLADIYDPHERGTKSLGGVLGGGLTSWLGWRSIFWFCTIISGICLMAFLLFFKDTFRKERSLTYQTILKERLKERARARGKLQDKDSWASTEAEASVTEVHITLRDVSPFRPIYLVLRRWNNVAMLLVNVGGRLSDLMLRRMRKKTGGSSEPEIRLRSTTMSILLFPAFIIACGWVTQLRVHVAAVVVTLFGGGFFCVMMYSSILAYIVDSNVGRSSSAVATNSVFRGLFAFMGTEVAVPLQDALGDGWMYTIWGGIVLVSGFLCIWTSYSGTRWRKRAEEREARKAG
ncbi:hypothetical protein NP233_g6599 [Leucocoprinus birnbaumii]|uniref:MFS general substrate transporter n=1 Tax=Leucocoprinus birnbaumii TaxID=56174 RepID=A0AAD5YQT0_9AGAR|nr:hypothetical protein NP233_g6599 [Leucocoprinus birnbaumii]